MLGVLSINSSLISSFECFGNLSLSFFAKVYRNSCLPLEKFAIDCIATSNNKRMIDKTNFIEDNPLTKRLIETLKRHPKRIVFTEGEDIRVLRAAEILVRLEAIVPILLGDKDKIIALAEEHGVNRQFIKILDPAKADDLPLFCSMLQKIERYRGKIVDDPVELISRPHNFAAMMVQYGQADGIIAGNQSSPSVIYRSLIHFISPLPSKPKLFGAVAMTAPGLEHFGRDGILLLADCGVNPKPSIKELAGIAIETGKLAHHILGRTPRIAMLSHSTHGSMPTKSSKRVAAATALAKEIVKREFLELEIDGEVQADVALDMLAAEQRFTDKKALQPADVLVFPNLDSANIAYKLLKHTANVNSYGQLIMGLTRHAAQLPLTASVDSIVGTAALVGSESIKYRELYPDGETH